MHLRYKCHTCAEWHEGLPSPSAPYPLPYHLLSKEERQTTATLTSDLCTIAGPDGTDFYARASLPIHVHGVDAPLLYGVWVSLSEESFARFTDLLGDRSRQAGEAFFGWLCTPLTGYPDTLLLKTYIHVQPWPDRPLVELEPTDHQLSQDYQHGITWERALELVAPYVSQAERS